MNGYFPSDDDSDNWSSSSTPYDKDTERRLADFLRSVAESMGDEGQMGAGEEQKSLHTEVRSSEGEIEVVVELGEFDSQDVRVNLVDSTTVAIRAEDPRTGKRSTQSIELPEPVESESMTEISNNKVLTITLQTTDW